MATSASGLAGSATGNLYALTVTARDVTAGVSSPTVPVAVVAGTTGSDSVSVATLSANIGVATPSFILGGGGDDTLNGAGMTGKLWFVGGSGADIMTAGSGADTFMYNAATESNSTALDVIFSFNASADKIDLCGLGVPFQVAGTIPSNGRGSSGNTLAAHSVGWQTSGGNTFVYVNTSGGKESISATDMKIELAGGVSPGVGNIIHL
jgi:Ca2+-binding RTX toxin-like protein